MFYAKFGFRNTINSALDSVIFGMRNPAGATKRLQIKRIMWTIGFDGTGTATEVGFGLSRYNTADVSGGSSPVRINSQSSANSASVVLDANIKTGAILTITSIVFEGNFHECLIPTTVGTVANETLDFGDEFILQPGEGISVRNAIVAVAGAGCFGHVEWKEVNR